MIKKAFASLVFVLVAVSLFPSATFADASYPWTNPTYIPNAVGGTYVQSAPADIVMTLQDVGTTSLRVTGTCTSLAAVAQGSNDGTNYTAINLYPIATGTSAPTAVASISAVGFWKANTAGFTNFKLHITALTATCTATLVGHAGGFNGTTF